MTEEEARDLLRRHGSRDGLEVLLADQPWREAPGGWEIVPALQGWRFRLEPTAKGVRIEAGEPGSSPAVWVIGGP
jgi:hypothetical protein